MKTSSSEDELTEKCTEKFKVCKKNTLNPLFLVNLKNSWEQKLYIPGYLIYVKSDFRAYHLGSRSTISTESKNNVLEFFIPWICPDNFGS